MLQRIEEISKRKRALLKELIDLDVELVSIRMACDHESPVDPSTIVRAPCIHCGEELRPGCKKSPKGFHVHEPGERKCIYCGTQIVGK